MSHFSVLVIGDDVDGQMRPYHEFECTGTDDEFVQNIDQTGEIYAEFEGATCSRYRDPAGVLHGPYDDGFYREPTAEETAKIGPIAGTGAGHGMSWSSRDWGDGRGYRTKIHFMPEGWTEIEVPRKQVEAFESYVEDYHGKKIVPHGAAPNLTGEHKYGYALLGPDGKIAKIIDRTNPNKKWDYWRIGGRWNGALKLKEQAFGLVVPPRWDSEGPAAPGYADQARKGDVDLEQMRADKAAKARALWKTTREITGGSAWESWDDTRIRYPDIKVAREEYWNQPALELLKASGRDAYKWDIDDDLALDEEIYVERQRATACTFFAFVRDGQWTKRGKMGWWASVSGEIGKTQWDTMFNRMLDEIPDDALLTVVDCHI